MAIMMADGLQIENEITDYSSQLVHIPVFSRLHTHTDSTHPEQVQNHNPKPRIGRPANDSFEPTISVKFEHSLRLKALNVYNS